MSKTKLTGLSSYASPAVEVAFVTSQKPLCGSGETPRTSIQPWFDDNADELSC